MYTKELITAKSLYNAQSIDYGDNFCLSAELWVSSMYSAHFNFIGKIPFQATALFCIHKYLYFMQIFGQKSGLTRFI